MNPANILTGFRALLILPLFYFTWHAAYVLATGYLVFFLFLDIFDGMLARTFHTASLFGKHFDMTVDTIGGLVVGLVLFWQAKLPPLFVLGFLGAAAIFGGAFVWGMKKIQKSYIASDSVFWKALKGAAAFGLLPCFMFDAFTLGWMLMAILYISVIKYFLQVYRA